LAPLTATSRVASYQCSSSGIVAYRQGDTSAAKTFLRESLAVLRDLREKWFIS
jgi:hypothetical protein